MLLIEIKNIINEVINNNPVLCKLNVEQIRKLSYTLHGSYYDIDDQIKNFFNKKISKSLCLNNKTIGGCILEYGDMYDTIYDIQDPKYNNFYYNINLKVKKEELNKYKDKTGIFVGFIGIEPEYRNKGYSKLLYNYINSLGNYTWGVCEKKELDFHFHNNRIIICEYEDKEHNGISYITATKI